MKNGFKNPWFLGVVLLSVTSLLFLAVAHQVKAADRRKMDNDLLARVIRAEGEAEPYVGQVAIGAVILNRIQSSKFPKTIAGVVYQPKAFESVSNGMVNRPATASCRKAAKAAIQGWDPSGGALFFFNPAKVGRRSYVWTRRIIQRIGKHVFAL